MPANPVTEADRQFAAMLDTLGGEALRLGDLAGAEYFFEAADWHEPPPDGRLTARMLLLGAALGRTEAGR